MKKLVKGFMVLIVIMAIVIVPKAYSTAEKIGYLPTQEFVLTINGTVVDFAGDMGNPMLLTSSRTFVPIRLISEYLGYNVDYSKDTWDKGVKKVWIDSSDTKVEITLNKEMAVINGKDVYIDYDTENNPVKESKAYLYEGRTYVPLRFVSEAFGADVKYNRISGVHHITITTMGGPSSH